MGVQRVLLLLIFVSSIDIGIPSIMCSRNLAIQLTISKLYAIHISTKHLSMNLYEDILMGRLENKTINRLMEVGEELIADWARGVGGSN